MPCELVVTGFGAFRGVGDNPTQRLIELLEQHKRNVDSGKEGEKNTETLHGAARLLNRRPLLLCMPKALQMTPFATCGPRC